MTHSIFPFLFALTFAIASSAASQSNDRRTEDARAVAAAAKEGDFARALKLASSLIRSAPQDSEVWMVRASVYELQRDYGRAISDYSRALKLDPKQSRAWQLRGAACFRAGQIAESIRDFDKYLALEPSQKPHHWQRGISLYYAGRYKDGKLQFELHQTVNPHDVENAVWHFLCVTRAEGLSAARKQLIPIDGDPRVPMAEVHRLFRGAGSPEEILAAAEKSDLNSQPLFYAHLYLGLYYEAIGDAAKSRTHIRLAAAQEKANGYMGDVARVHWERMKKSDARGKVKQIEAAVSSEVRRNKPQPQS